METKVFFQVCRIYTRINSQSVIGKFDSEEDALNYAKLSKIAEPNYGFSVIKVTEEVIFESEEKEKGE